MGSLLNSPDLPEILLKLLLTLVVAFCKLLSPNFRCLFFVMILCSSLKDIASVHQYCFVVL